MLDDLLCLEPFGKSTSKEPCDVTMDISNGSSEDDVSVICLSSPQKIRLAFKVSLLISSLVT